MENPSKLIIKMLLDDDMFIRWVMHPTPELDVLWQKKMMTDEELKNNIKALKDILEHLKVEEPELSADAKKAVWEKIESRINETPARKRIMPQIRWAASIAASIVILAGGYWYLTNSNSKGPEIDYSQYVVENTDALQSSNINLILSDNQRIDIDKDSSVIAYDAQGAVNINSQKIEEAPVSDNTKAPELNQLIVPYGKTTSLILSDGTKVWVNSGSKLVYPAIFDKSKREIFLTGEAFVEVARNEKVPFIVKTSGVELNVLGTSFNISAYNDDQVQSVVLVTGSVAIKSQELPGSYTIEPNQMFSYVKDSHKVNIEKVDVANYISWKYGYLISEKERLDILFQKLSRHFNVSFMYDKESFMRQTFSGKLDLSVPMEEVLNYLAVATANKLTYNITDEYIYLKFN